MLGKATSIGNRFPKARSRTSVLPHDKAAERSRILFRSCQRSLDCMLIHDQEGHSDKNITVLRCIQCSFNQSSSSRTSHGLWPGLVFSYCLFLTWLGCDWKDWFQCSHLPQLRDLQVQPIPFFIRPCWRRCVLAVCFVVFCYLSFFSFSPLSLCFRIAGQDVNSHLFLHSITMSRKL